MREFGSDFHKCDAGFRGVSDWLDALGDTRLYACGRHAIEAVLKHGGWKRIWMPAYFCYEVIGHIKSTGIEVCLYDDYPLCEQDCEIIQSIPYREGDVVLRINYFGLRWVRVGVKVPVIEDCTHNLLSGWSSGSDADYCVASLRKSLPVAAGGVLWSPKGLTLPGQVVETAACKEMAEIRYKAMEMKAAYLRDGGDKGAFRDKYIDSEKCIDNLPLSGMDVESERIVRGMDIKAWLDLKRDNWHVAKGLLDKRFCVLEPLRNARWYPFSLVFLCKSAEEREALKKYMIDNCIYPAILWRVPEDSMFERAKDFSERMLSVHCDARYGREDICQMCNLLNGFYDTGI